MRRRRTGRRGSSFRPTTTGSRRPRVAEDPRRRRSSTLDPKAPGAGSGVEAATIVSVRIEHPRATTIVTVPMFPVHRVQGRTSSGPRALVSASNRPVASSSVEDSRHAHQAAEAVTVFVARPRFATGPQPATARLRGLAVGASIGRLHAARPSPASDGEGPHLVALLPRAAARSFACASTRVTRSRAPAPRSCARPSSSSFAGSSRFTEVAERRLRRQDQRPPSIRQDRRRVAADARHRDRGGLLAAADRVERSRAFVSGRACSTRRPLAAIERGGARAELDAAARARCHGRSHVRGSSSARAPRSTHGPEHLEDLERARCA